MTAAYDAFLASGANRRERWLFTISSFDRDAGALRTWRKAFPTSFTSGPSESLPNATFSMDLESGLDYVSPEIVPGQYGFVANRQGGTITIKGTFEEMDALRACNFVGHRVEVRHGGGYGSVELGYDDYALVRVAEITSQRIGVWKAELTVAPDDARMDDPIETRVLRGGDWWLEGNGSTGFIAIGANVAAAAKCQLGGDLTYGQWYAPKNFTAGSTLLGWGTLAGSPFHLSVTNAQKLRFRCDNGAVDRSSAATLVADYLYHLAWRVDDDVLTFVIYDWANDLLTVEEYTESGLVGRGNTPTENLVFGKNITANDSFNRGFNDSVFLVNRAMSLQELDDVRNAPFDDAFLAASSTKLALSMDQGSGTAVTDSSASPITCTINGTMTWRKSLSGDAGSAGATPPNGWGYCENIQGRLVTEGQGDDKYPVYMLTAGRAESVAAFHGQKQLGTVVGTTVHTTLAAFYAADPPTGKIDVLAVPWGTFARTATLPSGNLPLCFTIEGNRLRSDHDTYVDTPAAIFRELATTRGQRPWDDSTEVDDAAFVAYDGPANFPAGGRSHFYDPGGGSSRTLRDAAGELIGGTVGIARVKRTGVLTVKIWAGAGASTAVGTVTQADVAHEGSEPAPDETKAESKLWHVLYRRNHTVHTSEQLSGATTAGRKRFAMDEWRKVTRSVVLEGDEADKLPRSRWEEVRTPLWYLADAIAVANRVRLVNSTPPQGLALPLARLPFVLDCGDDVIVDWKAVSPTTKRLTNVLGTSETSQFVVLSLVERGIAGLQQARVWRQDVDA